VLIIGLVLNHQKQINQGNEMIEELEILKLIIGDLTGVGVWGIVAWILYKLATAAMLLGGVIYAINAIYKVFTTSVTKQEALLLQHDNDSLKREIENQKHQRKMEVENIKHMYKILKEGIENERKRSSEVL
jgi:hypothetical protein